MIKKTLLILISLLVAFALLEFFVRVWDPNGSIRLYQDDVHVGRTYKFNLDTLVRADDGSYAPLITNHHGFIGPDVSENKPTDTLRIVHLGDSFTSGHDVGYQDKYVTLVGTKLIPQIDQRVEGLNFGIPSQGTAEAYLRYVHKAQVFDPDIVILYFFFGNDFLENLEHIETLQEKFTVRQESSAAKQLAKKSELILYVLNRLVQIPLTNELLYRVGIISERGERGSGETALDNPELPASIAVMFTEDDERNKTAIDQTREYLTQLRETVEKEGRTFVLVAIPRQFQVDGHARALIFDENPSLDERAFNPAFPNQILVGLVADTGITHYIDLTPEFEDACAVEEMCPLYICTDCHLSVRGHELVSDRVSAYLHDHVITHTHDTSQEMLPTAF